MRIGYARVSTINQNVERQTILLKENGCEEIFIDKITGKTMHRKALEELKRFARSGDTIYVESWSRLSRSLRDLLDITEFFEKKGVFVVSLKENFDTSTPQGKMIMSIFGALSEFERELINERAREGMEAARLRGEPIGRPQTDEKIIERALKLKDSGEYSVREIAEMTGISRATIYRAEKRREMNKKE